VNGNALSVIEYDAVGLVEYRNPVTDAIEVRMIMFREVTVPVAIPMATIVPAKGDWIVSPVP
jgi:hypothetical protein